MENSEKDLIEKIKSIKLQELFKKGTYVDYFTNNIWCQGIIKEINQNKKYDVIYIFRDNQHKRKSDISFSSLSIIGENTINNDDSSVRAKCLNNDIYQLENKELIELLNQKIKELNINLEKNEISVNENENKDEKENNNNYTGFNLYQFLSGTLIDALVFIKEEIEPGEKLKKSISTLIIICLKIVVFILEQIKLNLSKLKFFFNNKKSLIFENIYAIIGSFELIIQNMKFIFEDNFVSNETISELKTKIINQCYELILSNTEKYYIPIPTLVHLISYITYSNSTIKSINKFQQPKVYQIFQKTIQNFSEIDIKNIKKLSSIKTYAYFVIKRLFDKNKENNERLVNECYFNSILIFLKSNFLEKKISALNSINDIIFDEDKFDEFFFQFFITKNKILEIFFEESTHDEVIKRFNELFKYLAKNDKLENDIIDKLVEVENKKELYKNTLIDVIEKLPSYKKEKVFNSIVQKFELDKNINDYDYLLKLIEACLIPIKTNNNISTPTEEQKSKENEEYEKSYKIGLSGLDLIFNYIIKDFDIKKSLDIEIMDKAIDTFYDIRYLKWEDTYKYIEKLFDNIKQDNEHKAVIQSIILIRKLLYNLNTQKGISEQKIFEKLDNEYNIFNLIINDLIRYTNLIKEKEITPEPDDIYEGIYTFKDNIEERFNIIFYFARGNNTNKGLQLSSKEHLEKIYSILKDKIFHNELNIFFSVFSRNIKSISNDNLEQFLVNIIQNEKEFDLSNFEDKSLFIQKVFVLLNKSEGRIFFDTKNTIVKKQEIKKLDLLFDILVKNAKMQNKISELLKGLCINVYDYKTSFCQEHWKNFINKIVDLFEKVQKEKNILGLSGVINLFDIIYSSCINFGGRIPKERDTHTAQEPCKIYQFGCPEKKKRTYKIKVGDQDKILAMRWKLGYYYDIQINNVAFEDKDGKRYTFKDDQITFQEVFPSEIYCSDKNNYVVINVCEEKDLFLKIEGNPKELIENNEKIFNILIQNLYSDSSLNDKTKKQIWNIISKFKKDLYINKIKKYGEKEALNEKEIKKIFNMNELYIFIYSLQCIKEYINKDENIKKNFLNNFIKVNKIDELLYNTLMNFDSTPNNCQLLHYECLNILLDMVRIIESYKIENDEESKKLIDRIDINEIFKKFSNMIIDLIKINFKHLYENAHFNEYDIVDEEDNDDKFEYIHKKIDKMISDLFVNIIKLIEILSGKNENIYMEYLFNNLDIFKNIFIYDFIKCEKKENKTILNEFLSKHLFNSKEDKFIQKYFDIILSVQIFNELVTNDINGSFFKELSSLMKKYETKFQDKNAISENNLEQFKKIIDMIINYIQTECDNAGYIHIFTTGVEHEKKNISSNSSKIESIFKFLKCILNLSPDKLVNYLINKIDICDLFLIKCILRKSNPNPLDTQKTICDSDKSRETLFDLLIFILNNLPEKEKLILEKKIWDILDSKHKLGFWKNNKISDWRLEPEGTAINKYVGLKNMSSTCYMNSIIQQFFMIPMFRETILSITNENTDTVLYQLQLLFSSLKTYECEYYNPKPFVVKSQLNFYEQRDADEYFGQFIDTIENDIKELYTDKNEVNPYKDLFKFFFGIKVIDELKFVDCGHKRFNEFYYNNIQLEIKGFNNIEASLKNYCKTEIMDGDNKINCEICNTKRTCHKRQIFKSLPNILVIALKRFEFDYDSMIRIKLNSYFKFPFELNMKEYLIEDNQEINTVYDLTGITIHDGSADFGHYYDFIKAPDNKWYKFNDTRVKVFNEDDIPKEAFGDQNFDEKREREEEDEDAEENNAYILIYTKKNFNEEKIENLENNFKTKLTPPPYTERGNINEENKSIINSQLFKFWTLENILENQYQEFILNLLKISLVNNLSQNSNLNLSNLEKKHPDLIKELKDEGYDINNNNNKNENNTETIFKYGLRYFFNVVLRISLSKKNKAYRDKYDEIIKIYLENDVEKCKYILEEFSDNDAINEYLVFCPSDESIKYSSNIIETAFNIYFNDANEKNKNKDLLYNYINSVLVFIYYNIYDICLEHVINLFNKLIHINESKEIIKYLKQKNIEVWIEYLDKDDQNEEDEANNDIIMSSENLPVLKSKHFLLTEKENLNINNNENKNRKSDINKAQEKKLKNVDINFNLMRKIGYELYKEK